jgi:flagellar biosynthetic protein FliR
LQAVAALAGVQIGFGFSNTVDINYDGQSPVLDHLFTGVATLIFFTGNFHHHFLIGANGLFSTMPPNAFSFDAISPDGLIRLSTDLFLVATRLSLPLIGALLLADVAMGLMARTSPQFNVFYIGMPIKMALGIFALVLMLPFVVNGIESLFGRIIGDISLIVRYR